MSERRFDEQRSPDEFASSQIEAAAREFLEGLPEIPAEEPADFFAK